MLCFSGCQFLLAVLMSCRRSLLVVVARHEPISFARAGSRTGRTSIMSENRRQIFCPAFAFSVVCPGCFRSAVGMRYFWCTSATRMVFFRQAIHQIEIPKSPRK
jgi:hypothetical protein